jgi:predicted amidohydrolase YtcJ
MHQLKYLGHSRIGVAIQALKVTQMRTHILIIGLVTLIFVGCRGTTENHADLVLLSGKILSQGPEDLVEALAVRSGRIISIGSSSEIDALIGPETRVIELDGRSVLPGLGDNHYHGIGGGGGADLSRTRSIQDLLDAISGFAEGENTGELIITNSDWHEGQLIEQRLPYRDDLDQAVPNHPVVVVRGGHQYVLNSLALTQWQIDETTPIVPGGRIGRYTDGRLNGELVDRAKELVSLPPRSSPEPEAMLLSLEEEYAKLHSRGLTSIRYAAGSTTLYRAIARLRDENRLTMRVNFLLAAPRGGLPASLDDAITDWPAMGDGDAWLQVGGVKLGIDGGFEGGLMRKPYEEPWGENGTFYGLQTVPRETFFETVRQLHQRKWRVATHAVGDAAIDLVLDAYETVGADTPLDELRWVIEHGFIAQPDHFPRMTDLGLVVTLQNHLYVAAPSLVQYWGVERAALTSPARAYLDAGIPISLGTDSPVVPWDPWWTLHHFSTRSTVTAGVLGEDQGITRREAIRAATEGYAYLTFEESVKGTLEVGKFADFIIVADDVLECADPCLENMSVDLTVVGGEVVYDRSAGAT